MLSFFYGFKWGNKFINNKIRLRIEFRACKGYNSNRIINNLKKRANLNYLSFPFAISL